MTWVRVIGWGAGILTVLFIGAVGSIMMLPEQPSRPTTAEVTLIAEQPFKSRLAAGGDVVIEFRSPDGLIGRAVMPRNILACAVGDQVRVERQGVSLNLSSKACRVQH